MICSQRVEGQDENFRRSPLSCSVNFSLDFLKYCKRRTKNIQSLRLLLLHGMKPLMLGLCGILQCSFQSGVNNSEIKVCLHGKLFFVDCVQETQDNNSEEKKITIKKNKQTKKLCRWFFSLTKKNGANPYAQLHYKGKTADQGLSKFSNILQCGFPSLEPLHFFDTSTR